MKKILFILLAVCVLVGCQNRKDDGVVEVGVILPLTGVSAELGQPICEAMKLAEKSFNDTSKFYSLKLVFEDGKSTANGSIFAFNKLQMLNPSSYIIFGDIPCSSLAESIAKYEVPVVTLAAAASNILLLNDNYYRAWTTSDLSGKKLSEYAISNLGAHSGVTLCMDNNYGNEFSQVITKYFTNQGGRILLNEKFDANANNNKHSIHKILSTNPDVIFVIGFGTGYISAIKQLRTLGYKGPILTDETITIVEYAHSLNEALDNVYFSSINFSPYDQTQQYFEDFVKPFYEKTGMLPNIHSVFGYLSVGIVADAISRCGNSTLNVRVGLQTMKNFNSIVGTLQYLPNRELELPIIVRKINIDGTY